MLLVKLLFMKSGKLVGFLFKLFCERHTDCDRSVNDYGLDFDNLNSRMKIN